MTTVSHVLNFRGHLKYREAEHGDGLEGACRVRAEKSQRVVGGADQSLCVRIVVFMTERLFCGNVRQTAVCAWGHKEMCEC